MFPRANNEKEQGFTLVELLVVVSIIALLASLLFPVLARAKSYGRQTYCMNNTRQLYVGWMLYAQDNNDQLAYNMGITNLNLMLANGQNNNWAGSLLDWELNAANTNTALNTGAALGHYVGKNASVFRCPSDFALSRVQRTAGWTSRSRSYSMNAMVGDAGDFMRGKENINNPDYHQYLKLGEFTSATDIFVFIDEHPDSIDDGYFLNRPSIHEWYDLPASYHNGSANLAFGDGHTEKRTWKDPVTKKPPYPEAANPPFSLSSTELNDFYWLMKRTSSYEEHSY